MLGSMLFVLVVNGTSNNIYASNMLFDTTVSGSELIILHQRFRELASFFRRRYLAPNGRVFSRRILSRVMSYVGTIKSGGSVKEIE